MAEYKFIQLDCRATDITGKTFGRLTAIGPVGHRGKSTSIHWLCICECLTETIVSVSTLNYGSTRSCGCLLSESTANNGRKSRTHGMTGTSEYYTWSGMIQRCTNPNSHKFPIYGARGITVCKRWLSFECFFSDMGVRPSKNHTIDRIDNNGPYAPNNCRWATPKQQSRNNRRNRMIIYNGKTKCLIDWARDVGINHNTLASRMDRYGWSVTKALNTPVMKVRGPLTYNGKTKPISEWARNIGLSPTGLKNRLDRGWPIDKALNTPLAR